MKKRISLKKTEKAFCYDIEDAEAEKNTS